MLRPGWKRFSEWLRNLPPRRRQALTSATLICFGLLSLTLYNRYWANPEYMARLRHAGLVESAPQGRASAGEAEAERLQSRALLGPELAAPTPPATGAESPGAPTSAAGGSEPAAVAAVEHMKAPIAAPVARGFGWEYSSLYGDWRLHDGIDYAAPRGAEVLAAAPGKVVGVQEEPREGLAVTLGHAGQLTSHYAGLAEVKIRTGETVAAGQAIGRVGAPGLDESEVGPHLHFSVERSGQAVDPASLLG